MCATACVENGPVRVENWPEPTNTRRLSWVDIMTNSRAANDLSISPPNDPVVPNAAVWRRQLVAFFSQRRDNLAPKLVHFWYQRQRANPPFWDYPLSLDNRPFACAQDNR